MTSLPIPEPLRLLVARHWEHLEERAEAQGLAVPEQDSPVGREMERVWAVSDFVAESCARDPALLAELAGSGDLDRTYPPDSLPQRVAAAVAEAADETELARVLRRQRRRELVRIAWRDITGKAPLEETTGDLSRFAEAVLDAALARLHAWQQERFGTPTNGAGEPQRMVIVAMGKLGAGELNFSSDIDLVFAVPESGETRGGRRTLTSEEYFIRLGQRLIAALEQVTEDGFVFRVDMRLRPFGGSGPLVATFDAMESYYQVHGRDWERYAWIKARPVAGDVAAGAHLLELLRPFVYRRYLDYGAFEALRGMKALIIQEVSRKGLEQNVKLGPGGIREVEFIAQAYQLIRGGREPALRSPGLETVLTHLQALGSLPEHVVRELLAAYRFLRDTEHRLQQAADRQTQALPQDEIGRQRLAFGLGFAGWDELARALETHRRRVQDHFEQVFDLPHEDTDAPGHAPLAGVWAGRRDRGERVAALAAAGYGPGAEEAMAALETLHQTYTVRVMTQHGRARLDRLMPLLIAAAGATDNPVETLRRLLGLLEAIARRSVYLSLLVEHPLALSQLVRLASSSPWITHQLTRLPLLLDELLDARSLYSPLDRAGLRQELALALDNVPTGDTEQEMDALRVFKQANVLRVAAADVVGAFPLMRISDQLTEIAEVVLDASLELARRDLEARHGRPPGGPGGDFLVVAYGKLGGIELGYGSDLDLVFLHGGGAGTSPTDGPRPVDRATFFTRLGRRLTHLLTTHTAAGTLYELDFRLRPSGSSGLLVSGLDAFEEYQATQAWTWEHQALVRARPVCGDPDLAERFRAVRARVLAVPRDPDKLRREVWEMRERMRQALGSKGAEGFNVKQDRGGIADIEFMVQYHVLRWSHEHPGILRYTDNIRILEGLRDAGLMAPEEVDLLMDAYRRFRAQVHRGALQEQADHRLGESLQDLRRQVEAVWERVIGPGGSG